MNVALNEVKMLDMRKLYIIVMTAAALLFVGCEKRFETSIDLGMNTKRVNITTEAQEFWVSLFSDGDWIVSGDLQDDAWIVSDTRSGSGNGTIHFVCSENTVEDARYVRYDVTGGSKGRTISLWLVQAGTKEKASEVELDI